MRSLSQVNNVINSPTARGGSLSPTALLNQIRVINGQVAINNNKGGTRILKITKTIETDRTSSVVPIMKPYPTIDVLRQNFLSTPRDLRIESTAISPRLGIRDFKTHLSDTI